MFAPANDQSRVLEAVSRVVGAGRYVLADEVSALEREFAAYLGTAHCIGVGNGTDALEISLRALEVGPGDTVLLAANAGSYGSVAVRLVGATPRYVEIDPSALCMSTSALAASLASGPAKAIIVTHLYGQMADMEAIVGLANAAGVPTLEDCAQSHGARRAGRAAGSIGDLGSFSFYPTKNLGGIGDGGAVVTSDAMLAERVRSLRQYSWGKKYRVETTGGRNSRLDEIQAAVLRSRLPRLDAANAERRAIAARYNAGFRNLPLRCPNSLGADYVAHLYVVRTQRRDALHEHLAANMVGSDVHYPFADHLQPAYRRSSPESLPITEAACTNVLSLPCYPGMPPGDVDRVIEVVCDFFAAERRAP
jgi:aminotransferase EvaB